MRTCKRGVILPTTGIWSAWRTAWINSRSSLQAPLSFSRHRIDPRLTFDGCIEQYFAAGKITTREHSIDGQYYTHRASQWIRKAWLKAAVDTDQLHFNIGKPQHANITADVHTHYHGDLIATLLNRFDRAYSRSVATALPSRGDHMGL